MKNYQTFNSNSKDSKGPKIQVYQSPDHSYISFTENNLVNNGVERERSSSISSLEQVIINDPGYNGSLFSSVLTMCNTIFGSGMLTIVSFFVLLFFFFYKKFY